MTILKVSSTSNPNSVAAAVIATVQKEGSARLQAIGAGAVNQAIKAIAVAREFSSDTNYDFTCIPAFKTIEMDDKECTAIRFTVAPIRRRKPKWQIQADREETELLGDTPEESAETLVKAA